MHKRAQRLAYFAQNIQAKIFACARAAGQLKVARVALPPGAATYGRPLTPFRPRWGVSGQPRAKERNANSATIMFGPKNGLPGRAYLMLHITFTGTRNGMTSNQHESARGLLLSFADRREPYSSVLHHGDCVGADDQANRIARDLEYRTEAHPSTLRQTRSFSPSDVVHKVSEAIARNHTMVDVSTIVIAAPFTEYEDKSHSGTWATIRYAARMGKVVCVVSPEGGVLYDA